MNKKWWLFVLVPLLLSGVMIGGAEIYLRQVHQPVPFLVDVKESAGFNQINPQVLGRFLGDGKRADWAQPMVTHFKKSRPEGSLRIVVQGGSLAAGYPYGYGASIAGMLYQNIKLRYPDLALEVIDLSLPGASDAIHAALAREVLSLSPDVVVLSPGFFHHSAIGGLKGPGVDAGHLTQLTSSWHLLRALAESSASRVPWSESFDRFMATMYLSEKESGQYPVNMETVQDWINVYQRADIPVVMHDVPFNQTAFAGTAANLNKALAAINQDRIALYSLQNSLQSMTKTTDLGWDYFSTPVHLNEKGYFLLANGLLEQIKALKIIGEPNEPVSMQLAWKSTLVTDVDRIRALHRLRTLFTQEPFDKLGKSIPALGADVMESIMAQLAGEEDSVKSQKALFRHYLAEKNWTQAGKIPARLVAQYPYLHWEWHSSAQMYNKQQLYRLAEYHHLQAVGYKPQDPDYLLSLSYHYFLTEQFEKSLEIIDSVIEKQPDNRNAQQFRFNITQKMGTANSL